MGNNIKRLEFDCVNRIKYEKREKFEESIFADVYYRAAGLAALIIEENSNAADDLDDGFCTEERFGNIISFWGERGMGKSSAMLSFALFLKKYNHNIEDRFRLKTGKKPEFYVLPRIDAAMLVKGEYLLDIILAKMWNIFEEQMYDGLKQDGKLNETKQHFGNVKKSYEAYRKAVSGEEKYEMTSVRQLRELSKCLNLKEDFKKLVESFLDCTLKHNGEAGFLVVAIDDLDVVVDDVNSILEQIRLFLSVPKVIVLATADYGRLFLDCNKSFSDRLICKENIDYIETRQIRGYSEKYLAKIFPSNLRVYMPRINVEGALDYSVRLPEGSNLIGGGKEAFDEKTLLFIMIAKYTGIMMYPFDKHRHFLQQTSLRGIVNELNDLEKMNYLEEKERFEATCRWILTMLEEDGKTVLNSWEYRWAQTVMEGNSVNETVVEILAMQAQNVQKNISKNENVQKEEQTNYGNMLEVLGDGGWTGYGQMMRLLVKLIESTGHDFKRFARFSLIFVSVQIAKMLRDKAGREKFVASYARDIFYPCVEEAARKKGNRREDSKLDSMPFECLCMKFSIPTENQEDIRLFFTLNHDRIINVFKLANICEWNLWDEENTVSSYVQYEAVEEDMEESVEFPQVWEDMISLDEEEITEEDTQKIIRLDVPQIDRSKVSIEMLLWNSFSYEEHLKGFCRNIYKALCRLWEKEVDEDRMAEDIKAVMANPGFRIEEYKKWKEGVGGIDGLLPWQSAELMLHLAGEIGGVQQLVGGENLLSRILKVQQRQMAKVIQEMERIEEYYRLLFTEKKRYSQTLTDYLKVMEPYGIDLKQINQEDEMAIGLKTAI